MKEALVVDDSKAVRMILTRTVSSLGYTVTAAADGLEALEAMQAHPLVSLVLVDWNMPRMNGLGFVKALRADRRFAKVKVMMVTTETEIEQMTAALEAGANDYVMKPFTPEIIAERIQMLNS